MEGGEVCDETRISRNVPHSKQNEPAAGGAIEAAVAHP
jgi:hypothetical protein